MTKQDMVSTVFSKLNEVLATGGFLLADTVKVDADTGETKVVQSADEKREEIAKLIGLVKGVRKVGGVTPTDLGFLFIGVDPSELEAAKEREAMALEIAELEAEINARKAKLAAKHKPTNG